MLYARYADLDVLCSRVVNLGQQQGRQCGQDCGNPLLMALAARLRSRVASRYPHWHSTLETLVANNSWTYNRDGVLREAALTIPHFLDSSLDFDSSEQVAPTSNDSELRGNHVVMRRAARISHRDGSSPKRVVLVSHLDTVYPPATATPEFSSLVSVRSKKSIYTGPGSMDIKGGTCMMMAVLDALCAVSPSVYDAIDWTVLLNASEEILATDFAELAKREVLSSTSPPVACLVFEAGPCNEHLDHARSWGLVSDRKGRAKWTVEATGIEAHAGNNHQDGQNAIVALSKAVVDIAALTDYTANLTFNVGCVKGGTMSNTVPGYAACELEMRARDMTVFESAIEAFDRLLASGHPSVRARLDCCEPPWAPNPGTEQLIATWARAAAMMGEHESVVPESRGGLSDGNFLWQLCPTLDGWLVLCACMWCMCVCQLVLVSIFSNRI